MRGTKRGLSETLTQGAQLDDCRGRIGSNQAFESTIDYKV